MTAFTPVKFQHANLNREVTVLAGTIAGYHWSDGTQSTHVYTIGGVFPVKEKPEDIDKKLTELNAQKESK